MESSTASSLLPNDVMVQEKRMGVREKKSKRCSESGAVALAFRQKQQVDKSWVLPNPGNNTIVICQYEKNGILQGSHGAEGKWQQTAEVVISRLQAERIILVRQALKDDRLKNELQDTVQQVLIEYDKTRLKLEEKEKELQLNENKVHGLQLEVKESTIKLQQEQIEKETMQKALDEALQQLKISKEETDRWLKEREEEESHRSAQKWTPINFERLQQLGRGAFGIVYKCLDKDSFRLFVAKETRSQTAKDIKVAKNEIELLKNMRHPNIISYYDYKEVEGTITIFMEYMAGGSVKDSIDKYGAISESLCINYIKQILDALAYIHKLGIVHSDLKCANLLLDGQGNIKLGDFGVSVQKRLNSADQSDFIDSKKGGGTYHWMAPEAIIKHECRRPSDIWSLGCTIIEMLTKKPPNANVEQLRFIWALGNLATDTQSELTYDPQKLVPKSSDKMKSFLSLLLVVDVNKRLQSGVKAMEKFKEIFC